MYAGISGALIPAGFLADVVPGQFAGQLADANGAAPITALVRWWRRVSRELGPASSQRAVLDIAVLPLVQLLGYEVLHLEPCGPGFAGSVGMERRPLAVLLGLSWSSSPDECWRDVQRAGRTARAKWGIVCTGSRLHLVDVTRTWSRRALEFDLRHVMEDEPSVLTLWALMRAVSLATSFVDRVVKCGDDHTLAVCGSLGDGVLASLGALVEALDQARRERPLPTDVTNGHGDRRSEREALFEQALTLVYRILFLLFAEARAVVPVWHRVYRDAYTIDALCRRSAQRPRARGLWEALQAISRLAHAGCRAGDLQVTPFNGRLFAPHHTPLAERARVPDAIVRQAVLALATGATPSGRRRIAYSDLGVEQLGAVYERVLEYEPVRRDGPLVLSRTSIERKSTGSFYTPRAITEFLVRRTLHPLVAGRSAAEILALRVVDPAMGSGAFLVAACRFLAGAAERALVASGEWPAQDVTRAMRVALRRQIAQRCLYGVDLNPMAVQLARLSLWLTTLATDRPLTFLDHHLATGDSLVGASLDDIARQPPGSGARARRAAPTLPLFDRETANEMSTRVLPARFRIAEQPDDTPADVRNKERALGNLLAPGTPLHRWKAAADLWCAGWFWPDRAITPSTYAELLAAIVGRGSTLSERQTGPLLERAASLAREQRAFHWTLEFPEVFFDRDGQWRADGGFDAVLGNPPWDVLRADTGSAVQRAGERANRKDRLEFFRSAGIYRLQSSGHANCYQLFVERALQLLRPGGRLGLILPSGLATDHGSASLRRGLFDSLQIDRLFGFTNRDAIFPIHRDVRFLLLTGTYGRATERLGCRFGLRAAAWLDTLPDAASDDPPDARPIALPRAVLEQWDPEHLSIPELEHPRDLEILAQISAAIPTLADPEGWHARFGRELNATDDRDHFLDRASAHGNDLLPVVEGKHLEPFRAMADRATKAVTRAAAAALLDRAVTFDRRRVAYRDVASATNRLTLIAALLPDDVVSTHTVFCLKTALGMSSQYCLLALLNSLVANYLVRLQVTTHVTAGLMARLPVPRPAGDSRHFRALGTLARELEKSGIEGNADAYAQLNSIAASLYGVTLDQYRHVLSTFPLLSDELRERCLTRYASDGSRTGME